MGWGRGYGYGVYSRIMKWSVDLDIDKKIWKAVKKRGNRGKRTKRGGENKAKNGVLNEK
jgi:hypothetical protein